MMTTMHVRAWVTQLATRSWGEMTPLNMNTDCSLAPDDIFFSLNSFISTIVGTTRYETGIIVLSGYAIPSLANDAMCLGIRAIVKYNVKVRCPKPPSNWHRAPLTSLVNLFHGSNWFSMITNEGLPEAVQQGGNLIDGPFFLVNFSSHFSGHFMPS